MRRWGFDPAARKVKKTGGDASDTEPLPTPVDLCPDFAPRATDACQLASVLRLEYLTVYRTILTEIASCYSDKDGLLRSLSDNKSYQLLKRKVITAQCTAALVERARGLMERGMETADEYESELRALES